MVSPSNISFSGAEPRFDEIDRHYQDTTASIRLYFSSDNPAADILFARKSQLELQRYCDRVFEENERLIAMNLLSALEAVFRIDYLQRCCKRKKDPLSRVFRRIHREKGARALLEDDIFDAWKKHTSVSNRLVSDLKSAFKYRHWLAHGRYWTPKLGRKYDYYAIFTLSQMVVNSFPLED